MELSEAMDRSVVELCGLCAGVGRLCSGPPGVCSVACPLCAGMPGVCAVADLLCSGMPGCEVVDLLCSGTPDVCMVASTGIQVLFARNNQYLPYASKLAKHTNGPGAERIIERVGCSTCPSFLSR